MDWLLSELVVQEYIDQKYINKFKARFPELNTADLTVKEYVTAMTKAVPRSGTRTCTKEQEKRASLLFNLVYYIGMSEMLEYDFRLQKKVERGTKGSPRVSPKGSPRASPKPGGGAKRTLRKSCRETIKPRKPRKTRKTKTRKCMKRKTA
jgi:hypothetical protein